MTFGSEPRGEITNRTTTGVDSEWCWGSLDAFPPATYNAAYDRQPTGEGDGRDG